METIIFDLDGTLSITDHRQHFLKGPNPNWDAFFEAAKDDAPNIPIIKTYIALQNSGYDMQIWTGRSSEVKEDTLHWLRNNAIFPNEIRMRKVNDHRHDTIIKEEWLKDYLKTNKIENILCVFDDRKKVVDFWRSKGITCLQVAEGNF